MSLGSSKRSMKIKKIIYLCASVVLGLSLSLIAHSLIEIIYINKALSQGKIVLFYGGCALPPLFQASLWIAGLVLGLFLGLFWWQKVYCHKS